MSMTPTTLEHLKIHISFSAYWDNSIDGNNQIEWMINKMKRSSISASHNIREILLYSPEIKRTCYE